MAAFGTDVRGRAAAAADDDADADGPSHSTGMRKGRKKATDDDALDATEIRAVSPHRAREGAYLSGDQKAQMKQQQEQ